MGIDKKKMKYHNMKLRSKKILRLKTINAKKTHSLTLGDISRQASPMHLSFGDRNVY